MKRYTYLTFTTAALISIMGCGEDVVETGSPPEVLSVTVAGAWELHSAEGWDIPSNASISVSFSKEMKKGYISTI